MEEHPIYSLLGLGTVIVIWLLMMGLVYNMDRATDPIKGWIMIFGSLFYVFYFAVHIYYHWWKIWIFIFVIYLIFKIVEKIKEKE